MIARILVDNPLAAYPRLREATGAPSTHNKEAVP
jgi:hypothetical protein